MKTLLLGIVIAMMVVPAFADDTIYDIQNGTIAEGTHVTLEDVVVTVGCSELYPDLRYMYIQEPAGGEYSGIMVYGMWADQVPVKPARGDVVTITAEYVEYSDLSELKFSVPGQDTCFITGTATVPAAELLDLPTMMSEPWEGVLCATECCEVGADLGYGEFEITDCFGAGVYDDRTLNYLDPLPTTGDFYTFVGVVDYSYGAYKLVPRDNADCVICAGTATGVNSWGAVKSLFR